MNHVKKMILVPQETVARMHDTPSLTPQSQMSTLDTEMHGILNKKYADDAEKWKHYSEALSRYLHFAGESRKPLTLEIESKPDDSDGSRASGVRTQLAAAIPKTYKSHALRIYDYLSQNHSPVTWDTNGTLSIDNSVIPHSNLIDSISDLTRARKNFSPPGTDALCAALARMNVPLELLGNATRRELVQKLKGQRGGGGIVPMPKTNRKKTIRKPAKKKSAERLTKKTAVKNTAKKYVWKTW